MKDTYCGKDCQSCSYREVSQCPGCKRGPGAYGGECKLASCCRDKGHESCDGCTFHTNCAAYRGREQAPQFRQTRRQVEQEEAQALQARSKVLGKWIWVIFWLSIVTLLGVEGIPVWETLIQVVRVVCGAAYAIILIYLGTENQGYRTAGILLLLTSVLNIPGYLLDSQVIGLFLSLLALVLGLVSAYQEYNAHSAVLQGLDDELSRKWGKLWKWYVGCIVVVAVGLVTFFTVLGVFLAMVGAIVMVVVEVIKIVYLYRTAQTFRALA